MRRRIPDWLTASRGLISAAIVGLIPAGSIALRSVNWLLLLGWTTDMLDGRLARRYDKGPTWIGDHEFQFDMIMVLASAIYLVATGYVPRTLGIVYLTIAVPVAVLTNFSGHFLRFKALTMGVACPWVFAPFIAAFFYDRLSAYVGLVWMLVALAVDWRRFLGVVGDFLSGARAYLHRS